MNWTKILPLRRALSLRHLTPWGRVQLLLRLPSLLRLSLALYRDKRVPLVSKVLAGGAIGLVLSPLDLPEFIPVAGQVWDVALITFILEFFVENCPRDVVREHVTQLGLQGKFQV